MSVLSDIEDDSVKKNSGQLTRDQALTVVLTILKAEQESISIRDLSERLSLPRENLLKLLAQLEEEKVIKKTRDDAAIVVPRGEERLRMAIKAVTLGARIEESAGSLSWKEFESFCTRVLEENAYSCTHEFRFKSPKGKRYECDIVALSNPMLVLADCKHYAGRVRGLRTVVDKQVERAIALDKSFPTLMRSMSQVASWRKTIIVPIIITLFPESISFVDSVPVIPAFKLNQFIQELPSNIEGVKHIDMTPPKQKRLFQL